MSTIGPHTLPLNWKSMDSVMADKVKGQWTGAKNKG